MNKPLIITILLAISIVACKTQQNSTKKESITNSDNSMNSLDWTGTYQGILPCADCEGIQTQIKLNNDLTYISKVKYLGKEDATVVESNGSFKWDEEGGKIILENINKNVEPNKYIVGENVLIKLDIKGGKNSGDLASNYILKKEQNQITERYWKLIELNGQPLTYNKDNSKEAHMVLKTENSRVSGNGGCNTFSGTYELKKGNRIQFSKMATTMMACMDMETEVQFLKVLETVDNYALKGDKLMLHKARMAPLAKFETVYFK